jgi:enoyl-CoA hydratase
LASEVETDVTESSILKHTSGAGGTVRTLVLNRPGKLNAADLEMQQSLLRALQEESADPKVRAIVLTGAGKAFSAGGDREIVRKKAAGELDPVAEVALAKVHVDTITTMLGLGIPVIAAVNGLAIGYSAGLVAMCDLVVMGEGAFLSDPHVTFGIPATTATQLMWPLLTSYAMAKELLMSGRKIFAEEALRLGLANRMCAAGDELKVALELADMFAALPRSGVETTKRNCNRPLIEEAARLMQAGKAAQ